MGCCICNIEKLANGFEVSLRDPAKAKKNDSKNSIYEDPMVSYAFNDMEGMLDFLRGNLQKAADGDDEYSSAFTEAVSKGSSK
jgi:hypothetical protein